MQQFPGGFLFVAFIIPQLLFIHGKTDMIKTHFSYLSEITGLHVLFARFSAFLGLRQPVARIQTAAYDESVGGLHHEPAALH